MIPLEIPTYTLSEATLGGGALAVFTLGYAFGLLRGPRIPRKCEEDDCFARIGREHDKCPGHRKRRGRARVSRTPDEDPRGEDK